MDIFPHEDTATAGFPPSLWHAFSESENAAAFADRAADTLSPTFFPLSRYLDT